MKKDITNQQDIESLVNHFYEKVRHNTRLGPIFNDIVAVDWDQHLPKMYAFWSSILLDQTWYRGNLILHHTKIHQLYPLSTEDFNEWLTLFHETIDEYFMGEIAEEAKHRSTTIARIMQSKILSSENKP